MTLKQHKTDNYSVEAVTEISKAGFSSYKLKSYLIDPKNPYTSIKACGLLTGCGLIQISGLISLNENTQEIWKDIAKRICEDYRVNTLFGAIGEYHKSTIDVLPSHGFRKIGEHYNIVHGRNYKQYLFLYELRRTRKTAIK